MPSSSAGWLEEAPGGGKTVAPGKRRDRLKTLLVGPSALDLLTWSVSWGFALPLRGICDEAWYRAGLRPLHLVKRSGLTRIESAESALHISLGRSPRNWSQTKVSRAVSPPHDVLRRSRSAARGVASATPDEPRGQKILSTPSSAAVYQMELKHLCPGRRVE